jgi:integrase
MDTNIKSKIFKRKTGKSAGKYIVRLEWESEDGPRRQELSADKKSEATKKRDERIREILVAGGRPVDPNNVTFAELAAIAKNQIYRPAVIVEGRKLKGTVKGHLTAQIHLDRLTDFFGKRRVRQITKANLLEYRDWRLKEGRQHPNAKTEEAKGGPVKLATINRELNTMRRVMNFAFEEKEWRTRPLSFKEVTDTDAERARERILSAEEEVKLLAACQGKRVVEYERKRLGRTETIRASHSADNPHLKALILIAIDAGMRRGEILKSEWADYDFEQNVIFVRSTNTKTQTSRIAPLTPRVKAELTRLRDLNPGQRPFPFHEFKRSWQTAKRLAGIEDLHFHDLRRTAITRWVASGFPLAFAGKVAGHTKEQTTNKFYIKTEIQEVQRLAAALDQVQQIGGEYSN